MAAARVKLLLLFRNGFHLQRGQFYSLFKNTEKIAKNPTGLDATEMILRLKNIASFEANWRDKAQEYQRHCS